VGEHPAASRGTGIDGELDQRRRDQQVSWTWNLVSDQLRARLHDHPQVRAIAPELQRKVRDGSVTATTAAEQILEAFGPETPDPMQDTGTAAWRSPLLTAKAFPTPDVRSGG